MGGTKPEWQIRRHMALIYGHRHLRGYMVFVAERKADSAAIGYAGPWFPHGWPEPEIGYALLDGAHGHGYATEAAAAGLRYAYEELGWHTAISPIHFDNAGSRAVARRMGAHFEATAPLLGDVRGEIWRHAPPEVRGVQFSSMYSPVPAPSRGRTQNSSMTDGAHRRKLMPIRSKRSGSSSSRWVVQPQTLHEWNAMQRSPWT